MGNLLRRYWHAGAALDARCRSPTARRCACGCWARTSIAFRDTTGAVGLVANACPHRGASLFFGRNEEAGLRCVYHGWKFDTTGACVDMPSEPAESNFKNKVRVGAYPTHESGGIVWTYMGPPEKHDRLPRPRLRLDAADAVARDARSYSPLQLGPGPRRQHRHDPHLLPARRPPAALQRTDRRRATTRTGPATRRTRCAATSTAASTGAYLEVQDTWYGFRYAGLRKTPSGYVNVRVSDFIMPLITYVPQPYLPVGGDSCIMMVPIDDDSYWRYGIDMKPAIRNCADGQRRATTCRRSGPARATPASAAASRSARSGPDNDYLHRPRRPAQRQLHRHRRHRPAGHGRDREHGRRSTTARTSTSAPATRRSSDAAAC